MGAAGGRSRAIILQQGTSPARRTGDLADRFSGGVPESNSSVERTKKLGETAMKLQHMITLSAVLLMLTACTAQVVQPAITILPD